MDYIIIGGDARMGALAKGLGRLGREARQVCAGGEGPEALPEWIREARSVVVNCPPKVKGFALTLEDVLNMAAPGATVYACGPGVAEAEDARLVDLWADEGLLRENADLTAEGAVSAAMVAGQRCMRGSRCVVIGWGRVGSALAELLVSMGAAVTVVSRTEAHRNRAIERGAEAVSPEGMASALAGAHFIFSTPPAPVLGRDALRRVDPEALILDLASPPYGVDLRAAWALGLRAWREPALPGRYCPESAGLALLNAILRCEGERQEMTRTHGFEQMPGDRAANKPALPTALCEGGEH